MHEDADDEYFLGDGADVDPADDRRTRRGALIGLAVVLVLVAVAIGVDYGAAALTESAVSREMRSQLNLADDPSVRINNFPFLTQALTGRYKSIDVTADHVAVGPLRDVQVRTQLRNVTAPLSQLLGGSPTAAVREAEGTVRIGAPDIERLLTGTSAAADQALRSFPGVGAWTSAEVRQRAFGDADAWSIGDYHVGKNITLALTGEVLDDDACTEILEPYRGHRFRVQSLLAMVPGARRPRYGPRMTLPTHTPYATRGRS